MNKKAKVFIYSLLIISIMSHNGMSQDLAIQVYKSRLQVDTMDLNGFATQFDLPKEDVKLAWWKYIKKKAVIFNKIAYYDLKIPSNVESNTDIFFISTIEDDTIKKITTLKIALREDVNNSSLQSQMELLLTNFKASYYSSGIQQEIKTNEKIARKLSRQIGKLDKQNQQLESKIEKKPAEGRALRDQIRKNQLRQKELELDLDDVNTQLDRLKSKLGQIK